MHELISIIRQRVLERDNYTCQICDVKNTKLEMHHIAPVKYYDEYNTYNYNLMILCEKCHKRFSHKKWLNDELLLSKYNIKILLNCVDDLKHFEIMFLYGSQVDMAKKLGIKELPI